MATANEQAARLFAEAITRGDIDAALAVCHPEIEFRSILGIGGRAYLGHDGIRAYFEDVESAWDEWSVDVERTAEAEDGRVVIVMTMRARGKGSGVAVADRTAHIWTIRDGQLAANRPYREPERALVDLGLEPSERPR
jgi:ketosteroid isomerase-like protein